MAEMLDGVMPNLTSPIAHLVHRRVTGDCLPAVGGKPVGSELGRRGPALTDSGRPGVTEVHCSEPDRTWAM
jgi:hypothetical protein